MRLTDLRDDVARREMGEPVDGPALAVARRVADLYQTLSDGEWALSEKGHKLARAGGDFIVGEDTLYAIARYLFGEET